MRFATCLLTGVRRSAYAVLFLPLLVGCAGATLGSGVGDSQHEAPPYFAGRRLPVDSTRVILLPVEYQRGAVQPRSFDPDDAPGSPVARLLEDINDYLEGAATVSNVRLAADGAPDVAFGCVLPGSDECAPPDDRPSMTLAVTRASDRWVTDAQALLEREQADHVILITLETGLYHPVQTGWSGSKAVRLGSRREQALPWLTSLETPVAVLQLTGALVGRDGRAVRIGAEGLTARRVNLLVSALGAEPVITDEDVEAALTLRAESLPGQPLVWQAALDALLDGLLPGR